MRVLRFTFRHRRDRRHSESRVSLIAMQRRLPSSDQSRRRAAGEAVLTGRVAARRYDRRVARPAQPSRRVVSRRPSAGVSPPAYASVLIPSALVKTVIRLSGH